MYHQKEFIYQAREANKLKKGKILGKSQIVLAVMVAALGLAIWFNVKYSNNNEKYLGQTEFVDSSESGEAIETGAQAQNDYFSTTRKERDDQRETLKEELDETIKKAGNNTETVKNAVDISASLSARQTAEKNIESLLKAKGFSDVLAIIGDKDINVIVKKEKLNSSETIQIQDVASAQSGYSVDKIKILTVK